MRRRASSTGGVYVHVPFCRTRCPYCDFTVVAEGRGRGPRKAFVAAVLASMRADPPNFPIRTLYFGGGTPSRLAVAELAALVATVRRWRGRLVEVTLEANPEDLTPERLRAWRRIGIDRLSVGVQRLDPGELKRLGRARSGAALAELPAALAEWRRRGGRANVDLIYGIPNEAPERFWRQVETVLAWPIDHLSAYALTVEPGTPFARGVAHGVIRPASEEVVANCYEGLLARVRRRGWVAYEVGNFARPGGWSRHNLAYWEGRPWQAYGPSAVAEVPTPRGRLRFRRPEAFEAFLADPAARCASEPLPAHGHLLERIAIGLRSWVGVPRRLWERWCAGADGGAARELAVRGWLVVGGGRVWLRPEARLVADEIAVRWYRALERACDGAEGEGREGCLVPMPMLD